MLFSKKEKEKESVHAPSSQIELTVNYLCINPYHWGIGGLSIQAEATMLWQPSS